jgi:hypothetical protein
LLKTKLTPVFVIFARWKGRVMTPSGTTAPIPLQNLIRPKALFVNQSLVVYYGRR